MLKDGTQSAIWVAEKSVPYRFWICQTTHRDYIMELKPVIGILLGDATGVGPELVARVAASGFLHAHCRPLIIGDERVFKQGMEIAKVNVPYTVVEDVDQTEWNKAIPLLDQKNLNPETDYKIGQISEKSGVAVLAMIEQAARLFVEKKIHGFVFAPFNKEAMKKAGCPFESEHHLLAHIFGHTGPFGEINVVGNLWTTRTTSHIPIKNVSANLTVDRIYKAIVLADTSLKQAGIKHPRLGLAALNPHAGEHGLCGREELDVINPAIAIAKQAGIEASGPYPSDILFIKAFNGDFDGVVTMYHDQGQIALKLKGFDEGITIAGGLPAPIATCAHGTAYDIAGKGVVRTKAFENAIAMTSRMASHLMGSGGLA
jgi:4-hydroxythreonine-4-phosphate dehydrogenase